MNDDYERIILVKPEIFIYRIPPRSSNRAYKAADWKLENPDWTGRLRIVTKANTCTIKLEDKISGELYAACPVDNYPGVAVESVADSARYFVIRIKDESGRAANIGIGFVDRSDSFDFNVALQDHFKQIRQTEEQANQPLVDDTKKLDLRFKEGQTFKLNIGKKSETSTSRQKPLATGSIGLLPPPPGPKLIPPPPSSSSTGSTNFMQSTQPTQQQHSTSNLFSIQNNIPQTKQVSNVDLLLDLDGSNTSAFNLNSTSNQSKPNNNEWVQF